VTRKHEDDQYDCYDEDGANAPPPQSGLPVHAELHLVLKSFVHAYSPVPSESRLPPAASASAY
jgi:hypothetical protein